MEPTWTNAEVISLVCTLFTCACCLYLWGSNIADIVRAIRRGRRVVKSGARV